MTLDKAKRLASNYARGFKRSYLVLIDTSNLDDYQVIKEGQTMPIGSWKIFILYDSTGKEIL